MPAKPRKLTSKERVFIAQYLLCLNGAEAARRAGYPTRTARQTAHNLLTKVYIRAEVEQGLEKLAMPADEVLARIAEQARGTIEPFIVVNKDGTPAINLSSPDAQNQLHILKSIKTNRKRRVTGRGKNAEAWETETVNIELHDSQKALEILARHHKIIGSDLEEGARLIVEGLQTALDKAYGTRKDD